MRSPTFFLTALLAQTTVGASAQTVDTTPYFPLAEGNTWTYFQVLDPPNAPPDTLWRGPYTVDGTVSIDDTLYYLSAYPFALADTLRNDNEGRVWARVRGEEMLLFDFTLTDGETYTFQHPDWPDVTMQVSISRGLTVDIEAGRFEDCIRLTFDDPQVMDEGRTYAFAPGIGIVYAYDGGGDYEELYSAYVHRPSLTAVEDAPALLVDDAYAYPNPFGTSTTIVLPFRGTPPSQAFVNDMLGRSVAVLSEPDCTTERCAFVWNGSGLSSGVYFVRLERGEAVQPVRLVLRR